MTFRSESRLWVPFKVKSRWSPAHPKASAQLLPASWRRAALRLQSTTRATRPARRKWLQTSRTPAARPIAVQANVGDPDAIGPFVEKVAKELGPINVLINNAGVYEFGPIEAVTPDHFHKQFNVNVLGLLLTTQAALKHFDAKGGSIVNLGSVAAAGIPTASVYSATKGAVDSITVALAGELGPKKIRVNSLNPGMVETEGVHAAGFIGSDFQKKTESETPLGRIGQPGRHRRRGGLSRFRRLLLGHWPADQGLRRRAHLKPSDLSVSGHPFAESCSVSSSFLFALHSPAIAGERAAHAYHAVAGHHQRYTVERAGTRYGARRAGNAHLAGQLAVGARLAARNLPQSLPHTKLKCRAAQIKWLVSGLCRAASPPTSRIAASTQRDNEASRRSVAAGNSARRLASASADVERQRQPA